MGLRSGVVTVLRNLIGIERSPTFAIQTLPPSRAQLPDSRYSTYAREGYQANELVFACIEELATSAAEPRWKAKVGGNWVFEHPILKLLNRPNPFLDRFEFWATVMMHRALAGNAYGLIVRSASRQPVELWLLRPDRVRIVPSRENFIAAYEYNVGLPQPVIIPPEDVIHWKTRHPLNDYYGMPPLMPISGRVDIDNFMKDFVKTTFERSGMPAGVLSVESKLDAKTRTEVEDRWSRKFGGPDGWHRILVVDNSKATFTPVTQTMGTGGMVIPELNMIDETRICMAFQVPPELIGALSGMQGSSYAEKRAARESFWDETLSPIYQDLAGKMNLRLVPDYLRVSEVAADLSEVRALLEDLDHLHARVRQDVAFGLMTIEEGREKLGYGPVPTQGTFMLPANLVPVPARDIADDSVDVGSVRLAATLMDYTERLKLLEPVATNGNGVHA